MPLDVLSKLPCPDGLEDVGVALWLFRLDLPEAELTALSGLLDGAEHERAAAFRHAVHRVRFIARRGWLRRVLALETGMDPAALRFATGAHGKPFLLDGGDVRFNASSAGGLGFCVVARRAEVGCDLAERAASPYHSAVADRFFHPAEIRAIRGLPLEQRNAAFLNGWTRKEAYVKALGDGLSHPLDSFAVSLGPEAHPSIDGGIAGSSLRSISIDDHHHAAIAILRSNDM